MQAMPDIRRVTEQPLHVEGDLRPASDTHGEESAPCPHDVPGVVNLVAATQRLRVLQRLREALQPER